MARYKLNTNVRLKGTFITVYIVDLFEDANETKYSVITEAGEILEKKESEIRPTFKAIWRWICWEFDTWKADNPNTHMAIYTFLIWICGAVSGYNIYRVFQ